MFSWTTGQEMILTLIKLHVIVLKPYRIAVRELSSKSCKTFWSSKSHALRVVDKFKNISHFFDQMLTFAPFLIKSVSLFDNKDLGNRSSLILKLKDGIFYFHTGMCLVQGPGARSQIFSLLDLKYFETN